MIAPNRCAAGWQGVNCRCAGRQVGFGRFELLFSVVIIGVLAVVLMERLTRYQEIAKNAVMEMTVSNLRSGLRLRVAELIMADRAAEIGRLAGQNPVQWLAAPPANYRGQLTQADAVGLAVDSWYFDPDRKSLVYVLPKSEKFLETHTARHTLMVQATANSRSAAGANAPLSLSQGVALTTHVNVE